MRVRFFTNAALEIDAEPVTILCDPWFVPGAFDGSWWQWPPLETKPEDVSQYTHLYVSHIHPDHCDVKTLKRLPRKDVPVIILKNDQPYLKNKIQSCGFDEFIELKNRQSVTLASGVTVTMYGAFAPNVFIEDAGVPNVIDSSIVISDGRQALLNANDNVPTRSACEEIRERHGALTAALLPYSGVGPYPSSYENLSADEKEREAEAKKKKYLERVRENARILEPNLVIPCAGQMILGGRQAHKNRVLGVPPASAARDALERDGVSSLVLGEGDLLDIQTGKLVEEDAPPRRGPAELAEDIAGARYWWEDAFRVPKSERVDLLPLLQAARHRMWSFQQRHDFTTDWRVGITVAESPDETYSFSMAENGKVRKERTSALRDGAEKFLQVTILYAYLIAILTRHCHWNNAYHGCHVEWFRRPNVYLPEIQILLSYFHL